MWKNNSPLSVAIKPKPRSANFLIVPTGIRNGSGEKRQNLRPNSRSTHMRDFLAAPEPARDPVFAERTPAHHNVPKATALRPYGQHDRRRSAAVGEVDGGVRQMPGWGFRTGPLRGVRRATATARRSAGPLARPRRDSPRSADALATSPAEPPAGPSQQGHSKTDAGRDGRVPSGCKSLLQNILRSACGWWLTHFKHAREPQYLAQVIQNIYPHASLASKGDTQCCGLR